jgi:hypothetical protein
MFAQVDWDFIDGTEPDNVAAELNLASAAEAIGMAVLAWRWSQDNAGPDGIVHGAGAITAIERAAGWTGKRGRWVAEMVRAGVLEPVKGGIRFRGWVERYGSMSARKEKARKAAKARWEKDDSDASRHAPSIAPSIAQGPEIDAPSNAPSSAPSSAPSNAKPPEPPNQKTLGGSTGRAAVAVRVVPAPESEEKSEPPPPPPTGEPLAVVADESVPWADAQGVASMRTVQVIRWTRSADGCWAFMQLLRELRGIPREGNRPATFGAWWARVLREHDGDAEAAAEAVEYVYGGYLGDPKIDAHNWPASVFIGKGGVGGIWDARKLMRSAAG